MARIYLGNQAIALLEAVHRGSQALRGLYIPRESNNSITIKKSVVGQQPKTFFACHPHYNFLTKTSFLCPVMVIYKWINVVTKSTRNKLKIWLHGNCLLHVTGMGLCINCVMPFSIQLYASLEVHFSYEVSY